MLPCALTPPDSLLAWAASVIAKWRHDKRAMAATGLTGGAAAGQHKLALAASMVQVAHAQRRLCLTLRRRRWWRGAQWPAGGGGREDAHGGKIRERERE